GDIGQMLEVVDKKPLNLITPTGMSPKRLSGKADLVLEITRPMLTHVPLDDYGVSYRGRWDNGSIRRVAGGMDLDGARMDVEGSLDKVAAKGVGKVGPYFGKIDFKSELKGQRAGAKLINLDGAVDVAGAMAGRMGLGEPLRARISTRKSDGQ